MRNLGLALVLGSLLLLPAGGEELSEESHAPAPWSPRLYLMDGGTHALAHQVLLEEREPAIPATIDSRWVFQPDPGADFWAVNLKKMPAAIAAFTKEAEKEQRVAAGKPRPLRVLWLGSVLIGAPDAWKQDLARLAKTALIIVPAGNNPQDDSSETWTSVGLKIGCAPGGEIEGSGDQKKTIVVFLDFGQQIEVDVPGLGILPLTATSTASALFAGDLADVLAQGVGANLTPTQIAARLRAGFRGSDGHAVILPESELEERITELLSK